MWLYERENYLNNSYESKEDKYIIKMRQDKAYWTSLEIETFGIILRF